MVELDTPPFVLHKPLKYERKAWGNKTLGSNFLYEEHINCFRMMAFLGLFPLHKDLQGSMRFKLTSAASISTITFLSCMFVINILVTRTVITNLLNVRFLFEESFLYSLLLCYPVLQFVPVLNVLEAKKIADYMNRWQEFHTRFETITGRKFPYTGSNKWILCELFGLSISVAFVLMYLSNYLNMLEKHSLNKNLHHLYLALFCLCTVIMFSIFYVWYMYTQLLKQAAEAILADVESLRWMVYRSLQGHLLLWMNLRQLCLGLGRMSCMTFLYLCSVLFIMALPILYVAAMAVMEGHLFQISMSFHTLLFISSLAEVAHRAVFKVGPNFESRLTELLLSGRATGCEEELVRFCQAVAANQPQISLGGYFNMDRGINVPLYSSVITYFVIIIQFAGEKKSS